MQGTDCRQPALYVWFRMNSIIKDVFIDYTKNYMTPGKSLHPVDFSAQNANSHRKNLEHTLRKL